MPFKSGKQGYALERVQGLNEHLRAQPSPFGLAYKRLGLRWVSVPFAVYVPK